MSEQPTPVEQRIKRAVERETPDVWPNILRRIEEERSHADDPPARPGNKDTRPRIVPLWLQWVGSAAAVVAIFFGSWSYMNLMPTALVGLEVNPSIELAINRSEKVISVTALDEAAMLIVDGMDLRQTELKIAVNALIGSMVKQGYISEAMNSILISVDSQDAKKGQQLQEQLTEDVSSMLSLYAVEGAVLSQTLPDDERLSALAAQYQISLGKARLVDALVAQDPSLDFAALAKLSVNDLNLLIDARNPAIQGVEQKGSASSGSYLDLETIKRIVWEHAGIDPALVTSLDIDLDYEDGRMVYEVEFKGVDIKGEYDIDATTGSILKFESTSTSTNETYYPIGGYEPQGHDHHATTTTPSALLSADEAMEIAFARAGVRRDEVRKLDCEQDEDDGVIIYEIEFVAGGMKIECDIDARSGAILHWKAKED